MCSALLIAWLWFHHYAIRSTCKTAKSRPLKLTQWRTAIGASVGNDLISIDLKSWSFVQTRDCLFQSINESTNQSFNFWKVQYTIKYTYHVYSHSTGGSGGYNKACSHALTVVLQCRLRNYTRNSSADEIANVNFLRRHRTRTKNTKREKQTVKAIVK